MKVRPYQKRDAKDLIALIRALARYEKLDPPTDAAAKRLAIDYVWIDQDDGPSGRDAVLRLTARPDLFTVVFRRADVAILQVR